MLRHVLLFFIFFSPLPFGSVDPVWRWFWIVLFAISTLLTTTKLIIEKKKTIPCENLHGIFALSCISVIWIYCARFFSIDLPTQLPLNFEATATTASVGQRILTSSFFPFFLSHITLFFALIMTREPRKNTTSFFAIIGHIVTIYSLYGLIAYFAGNKTILWFEKAVVIDSLSSTFVNRNNFATYCGIGIICLLGQFFSQVSDTHLEKEVRISSRLMDQRSSVATIGFLYATEILIMLSALILSGSRGGLVATTVAMLVLLAICPRANKNFYFVTCGILSLLFFSILISGERLLLRLSQVTKNLERVNLYQDTVNLVFRNPFSGYGEIDFDKLIGLVRTESLPTHFVRAHNDILELTLRVGVVSATLQVFVVCYLARHLIRLNTKAMSGMSATISVSVLGLVCLHSLVDFPFQIPAISYLLLIIIAASLSSASIDWQNSD